MRALPRTRPDQSGHAVAASLSLPRGSELRLERRDADEAFGRLVGERLAGCIRRQRLGVERLLGTAADDRCRGRLEQEPNFALDDVLRGVDEGVDCLAAPG